MLQVRHMRAGGRSAGFDQSFDRHQQCPVPALLPEKKACGVRVRDAHRAGLVRRGRGYSPEEGGLHPCIPSTDLSSAFFVLGTAPSTGNAAINKADKNPSPCGVRRLIGATKQTRKTVE